MVGREGGEVVGREGGEVVGREGEEREAEREERW